MPGSAHAALACQPSSALVAHPSPASNRPTTATGSAPAHVNTARHNQPSGKRPQARQQGHGASGARGQPHVEVGQQLRAETQLLPAAAYQGAGGNSGRGRLGSGGADGPRAVAASSEPPPAPPPLCRTLPHLCFTSSRPNTAQRAASVREESCALGGAIPRGPASLAAEMLRKRCGRCWAFALRPSGLCYDAARPVYKDLCTWACRTRQIRSALCRAEDAGRAGACGGRGLARPCPTVRSWRRCSCPWVCPHCRLGWPLL